MRTTYSKILKFASFIFLTLIPSIGFYSQVISKINDISIIEYYSQNLSTLIFMILIGVIIGTLAILFWNQYDISKKRDNQIIHSFTDIKKGLVDHALRIDLYRDILFRLTINYKTCNFDSITNLDNDSKIYLGFNKEQLNSKDNFIMPDLNKPLYLNDEHWEILKDDYNRKNKIFK